MFNYQTYLLFCQANNLNKNQLSSLIEFKDFCEEKNKKTVAV